MDFEDHQVSIVPGHGTRKFSTADYYVGRTHLFHERTYANRIPSWVRDPLRALEVPAVSRWASQGSLSNCEQWLPGRGTKEEIEALAAKHGGFAFEEFYPADCSKPLYCLGFRDTERAMAFCRTKDFDDLCATMAKFEAAKDPTARYLRGDCDVMAIALHRLTGHPLGIWAGRYRDADGEIAHENAHAVVVLSTPKGQATADVRGVSARPPDNFLFTNETECVELLRVDSENDLRTAFSSLDIDEREIAEAMQLARDLKLPEAIAEATSLETLLSFPAISAPLTEMERQSAAPAGPEV